MRTELNQLIRVITGVNVLLPAKVGGACLSNPVGKARTCYRARNKEHDSQCPRHDNATFGKSGCNPRGNSIYLLKRLIFLEIPHYPVGDIVLECFLLLYSFTRTSTSVRV